jgi:hypothetical protein
MGHLNSWNTVTQWNIWLTNIWPWRKSHAGFPRVSARLE